MSKEKLTEEQKLKNLDVSLCQRNFAWFVTRFWSVLEPNELEFHWYLDWLCDALTRLDKGDINRLLINIPPRHLKSLICTVFFPAWVWTRNPAVRFLCATYAFKLIEQSSANFRRLIESPLFQDYFPHVSLRRDRNSLLVNETTAGGRRFNASIDSNTLGHGADVIIADDLNNLADIDSIGERERVITYFRSVLSTRFNDARTGKMIIIQQRCHVDDLTGWLIKTQPELWQDNHIILPYEYEPERQCKTKIVPSTASKEKYKLSTGWKDIRTEPGEVLSGREPTANIEALKRTAPGQRTWATMYQQVPTVPGGNMFKDDWFRYFTETDSTYVLQHNNEVRIFNKKDCWRFVTVDLAISQKSTADYTVFCIVDVSPHGDLIIPYIDRRRITAVQTLAKFHAINATWHPHYFMVEATGYQDCMAQLAQIGSLTVRKYKPTTDKITRAIALEAKLSAGQVWFPKHGEWVGQIEQELMEFPHGTNDDGTDALTMASYEVSKRVHKQAEPEPVRVVTDEEVYYRRVWEGVL